MEENNTSKWHLSKYNLFAKIPDKDLIGCVNLLKGSYSLLTAEEVEDLQNLRANEKFVSQGFIVNYDEIEAMKLFSKKECGFSDTLNLTICPTLNCNFNCPYCFEEHRKGKMSEKVQDDVIIFIKKMTDAFRAKRIFVTWFGGEPLLAPDVIENLSKRIIDFTDGRNIQYNATIITNGYLLTQEIADMLSKYRVNSYQITLDGIEEMHDRTRYLTNKQPTFSKIIENITKNKIHGQITIRYNITSDNIEEEDIVKKYVANLAKISNNNITCYSALVLDNKSAKKRKEQVNFLELDRFCEHEINNKIKKFSPYKASYCGAQILSFVVIDELGNLYKCWEDSGKLSHSYGKVQEWEPQRPVQTCRNSQILIDYINSINGGENDEECLDCIWLPTCRGGCPQRRLFYDKACVTYKNTPEEFVLKFIDYKEKNKQQNCKCC